MKTNELTDGIYIYFNCFDGSKIIVKVTGFKDGVVYGVSDTGSHWCTIEKVEPIPITPEILKNNGFVFLTDLWYLITKERHMICCRKPIHIVFKDNNVITLSINATPVPIGLKFVHQLQQIMCLCEITHEIIL